MEVETEEECRTPRSQVLATAPAACPPPPRKNPSAYKSTEYVRHRELPEQAFFKPPDLELIFISAPRKKAETLTS
ncbi:hypothetical protein SAY87_009820 [Trapa incisa]|uniref:Uncharacterized protein n=1 Tax=Trapa incisa TaxID=236973 RepID=A0AAN7PYM9_9MYRT|nr:hypothetical protein SAY87_009820 [Trapa incisa]